MVGPVSGRRAWIGTLFLLVIGSLGTTGCAGQGTAPAPASVQVEPDEPMPAWRRILSDQDLGRLERVGEAWTQALETARSSGFARSVRGEGGLLDPDAALPHPALPPGSYRCRLIRIGAAPRGRRAYISTESYFCHVGAETERLSLTKQTGTDKPGGYIYEDGPRRSIFLGSRAMDREEASPAYGERPERDVAGIVERIGPFRYRLVVPFPPNGAMLDVYELRPVID